MTRYFTANGTVERRPITNRCEVCGLGELSIFHWLGETLRCHQFVPHFKHHFKLVAVKNGKYELTMYVFQCTTEGCKDKWMTPKWTLFKRPRAASVRNLWNHDFERRFNSAQEVLNNVMQDNSYEIPFDGRPIL